MPDPTIGQRVRSTIDHKVARMDPRTGGTLATLTAGVEGTVVEYWPDTPGPCLSCPPDDLDECDVCDGTGTIPADPVWVVEWDCPEGPWRRLIRADGEGWEDVGA